MWFTEVLVPNVEGLQGPIVLIGDNVGSHFSCNLVRWAKERNNFFSMLLANATHLLQPLDVAVFAPMKKVCRNVLKEYRVESKRTGDTPKEVFPRLLSLLCSVLSSTMSNNLQSGFRTCDLFPLNRQVILDKLPDANRAADPDETASCLNETVVGLLKQNRCSSETEKKKRGKRVPKKYKGLKTVVPGKILETSNAAVLNDAVDDASDDEDDPFRRVFRWC